MKALITGASNGIGKEMAIYLSKLGYDLVVVARSGYKLEELKKSLKTEVLVYECDLSILDNCYKLNLRIAILVMSLLMLLKKNTIKWCLAEARFPRMIKLKSC